MFILDQFYVAIADGEIAGVTACTDGKTLSVRLNKKELRKHLGFFKGSMAGIFLKKEFETSNENFPPYTGSIGFVGTAPKYRGQGVAFQIIQRKSVAKKVAKKIGLNHFLSLKYVEK